MIPNAHDNTPTTQPKSILSSSPMAQFPSPPILSSSLLLLLLLSGAQSATLTLYNNCDRTVWPGMMSNAGRSPLPTTGFPLEKGQSKSISAPPNWSGRLWARTACTAESTGKFSCGTGDCGSGKVECSGEGAPPATLAEFTLGGDGGMDFYDVSLVDGYNVPITVAPQGGSGVNCTTAGCGTEINGLCPQELRVVAAEGSVLACRSACDAFGSAEYCCSGAHANPNTCPPTSYSELFKKACPRAYSYAYDDSSSTFTCSGANSYLVTFCPFASGSQRSAGGSPQTDGNSPPTKRHPGATMVYLGGNLISGAATTTPPLALALTVTVTPLLLRLLGCPW